MLQIKYLLITLGIVGLIVLYVFEFEWLNRTFHSRSLVFIFLLLGALVGYLLSKKLRKTGKDWVEKLQLTLLIAVPLALFAPLLGSLSNRLLSFRAEQSIPVELVEEKAYFASIFGVLQDEKVKPTGYRSFFYKDQQLLRLQSKTPLFEGAEQGDTVQLPLKKGLWGFEFVPK